MTDRFTRYDVYAVAGSRYCYPGTQVLRNRFHIRDAAALRALEADLSAVRQSGLLEQPIEGRFSARHLCRIHRYLLGDLYTFAGHYRTEDIAKGETRFLAHGQIRDKLPALLAQLAQENHLRRLEADALTARAAWYLAELNYIHPFREGNGRAIREFMRLLFRRCGYAVDWGAVPAETLLTAMERSVYDPSPLEHVLNQCLKKNRAE